MKNKVIKIVAFTLLLSVSAFATNPSVPRTAVKKLIDLYPEATKIDWKFNHGYEADFTVNNKNGVSIFNAKGDFLYSRLRINFADLPDAVRAEVQENYLDKDYELIDVVQRWYKGRNLYDVEVKTETKEYLIRYSASGRRLSRLDLQKQKNKNR